MNRAFILFVVLTMGMVSCIGDDFIDDAVDPEIRIITPADTIAINQTFQFEYAYFNNVGIFEEVEADWSSTEPAVISIDENGLASALEYGSSEIRVEYSGGSGTLSDSRVVVVGDETVISEDSRSGNIVTTSSYTLHGSFEISVQGDDILIEIGEDYAASSNLPGLYLYLTNNPSTTNGALEIGPVQVYSGAHSYTVPDVGINDYDYLLYFCAPFNVKVGEGQIF